MPNNDGILTSEKYRINDIPTCNFAKYVIESLKKHPDKLIINGTENRSLSFGEIADQAVSIAKALQFKYAIRPGDVVTVSSRNTVEQVPTYLGILLVGATINTIFPGYNVESQVVRTEALKPVLIFSCPEHTATAKEVKDKLISVKSVISLGDSNEEDVPSYQSILQEGSAFTEQPKVAEDVDAVAFLLFSSGTTGMPKRIMQTHRTALSGIIQVSHPDFVAFTTDDIVLSTTYAIHGYCMFDAMFKSILHGSSFVMLTHYQPDVLLKVLVSYKVTYLVTDPSVIVFLLKDDRTKQYDLSHFKYIMSATTVLPSGIGHLVKEKLNLKSVIQLFGQTEICMATATPHSGPFKPDSIGIAGPNIEIKIVDRKTGKPVGSRTRGELLVRGPNVMKGYYQDPEKTKEALDDDGWLHTGDICYYEEDGYIYLVDRVKELIKHKGCTVSPSEVEAVLHRLPAVSDCAVVGLPHVEIELVIHAVVVKSDEYRHITKEQFIQYIQENAQEVWQLIGGVTFVEKIPRNFLGKIMRNDVARLISRKQTLFIERL